MEELRATAAKRWARRRFPGRLQLALAAQLGSWQHDPVRLMRARELFDFASNEMTTEELMARVHQEDVNNVSTTFKESLDPLIRKRSAIEFRLRRRNGE